MAAVVCCFCWHNISSPKWLTLSWSPNCNIQNSDVQMENIPSTELLFQFSSPFFLPKDLNWKITFIVFLVNVNERRAAEEEALWWCDPSPIRCYFIQTAAHKEHILRPASAHDRCRYFIYVSGFGFYVENERTTMFESCNNFTLCVDHVDAFYFLYDRWLWIYKSIGSALAYRAH